MRRKRVAVAVRVGVAGPPSLRFDVAGGRLAACLYALDPGTGGAQAQTRNASPAPGLPPPTSTTLPRPSDEPVLFPLFW
jgi:hypothetical protein